MTLAVGHALQGGHVDRAAIAQLARARSYDGSVGCEVALTLLELELLSWWKGRPRARDARRATSVAVIRGLVAASRDVAARARRRPRLPITGWRSR